MTIATTTFNAAIMPARLLWGVDTAPGELCGWAALDREETASDAPVVQVELGGAILGQVPRGRSRPDVDAHLGKFDGRTGFSIPDTGLHTFARLAGLSSPRLVFSSLAAAEIEAILPDNGGMPLGLSERGLGRPQLTSLWISGSRSLSLRFDGAAPSNVKLDTYQLNPDTHRLTRVTHNHRIRNELSLVTTELINPLLPILLVLKSNNDCITAIDVLPYPSLLRGGAHHAELLAMGSGSARLHGLPEVTGVLLAERLAITSEHARVAEIILAPGGTGLEPMLDRDVLEWIASLGIRLVPQLSGDDEVNALIAERVAPFNKTSAARDIGHAMFLPSGALPSINALVRELPLLASGATATGPRLIVDEGANQEIWSLSPPETEASLDWLRLRGDGNTAAIAKAGEPRPDASPTLLQWPIAVEFIRPSPKIKTNGVVDVSGERAPPSLRDNSARPAGPVGIVILPSGTGAPPLALLESLKRQNLHGTTEVLAWFAHSSQEKPYRDALLALFPARFRLLPAEPGSSRVALIKAAAKLLGHELIVVVEPATVLHDTETLSLLLALQGRSGAATVGCVAKALMQGGEAERHAGYLLGSVDLRSPEGLRYARFNGRPLRSYETVPVVASPLCLLVCRSDALNALPPSAGAGFREPWLDDVLLGVEMLAHGLNLCATLTSVTTLDRSRHLAPDLKLPAVRLGRDLQNVLTRTTVLQKLR